MVILPRELVNRMLAHALSEPEREVCGLLSSDRNGALRYVPVRNRAGTPQTRYEMDPREQVAAFRSIRERGEALFAIFHSHPTSPAVPSEADLQQANYPDALYLIASIERADEPELRCYQLETEGFRELEWSNR